MAKVGAPIGNKNAAGGKGGKSVKKKKSSYLLTTKASKKRGRARLGSTIAGEGILASALF